MAIIRREWADRHISHTNPRCYAHRMVPFLWVIDDFLRKPEAVREKALSLTYSRTGYYPGRGSVEQLKIEGLEETVSSIVRQEVYSSWPPDHAHSTCRLTLAQHNEEAPIHIDPNQLSGVLYLSRPDDCQGGTEFYRHKRTGTDRMPMDVAGVRALGYESYPDLMKDMLHRDGRDRSKWELSMMAPMRFNRLILFQPQYWHTAGPGFGQTAKNGRLVYLMFFQRVRPQQGAPSH